MSRSQRLRIFYSKSSHIGWTIIIFSGSIITITAGLSNIFNSISKMSVAVITIFATLLNIVGSYAIQLSGRANPTLARSMVKRLTVLSAKVFELIERTNEKANLNSIDELKTELATISIHMQYLNEAIDQQVYDWEQFHKEAIQEVLDQIPKVDNTESSK